MIYLFSYKKPIFLPSLKKKDLCFPVKNRFSCQAWSDQKTTLVWPENRKMKFSIYLGRAFLQDFTVPAVWSRDDLTGIQDSSGLQLCEKSHFVWIAAVKNYGIALQLWRIMWSACNIQENLREIAFRLDCSCKELWDLLLATYKKTPRSFLWRSMTLQSL